MPDRYSEWKLEAALALKMELVTAIGYQTHGKPCSDLVGLEWPDVVSSLPSRDELRRDPPSLPPNTADVEPQLASPRRPSSLTKVQRSPGATGASSDDDSASEGEADKASSGSSTVSSSVLDDAAVTDDLEWLLSKGKKAHLHLMGAPRDGQICSACGRRLRQPGTGVGLEEALSSSAPWSPRCWAKLPEDWQTAFLARGDAPDAGDSMDL